jgi:transcriptional regulator with XRE-family HTH domain
LGERGEETRKSVDQTSISISNISLPADLSGAILLYEEFLTKATLFIITYTDQHPIHFMPKIIESDDIPGIQRLIQRLSAAEGISVYQLAVRSNIHPTTLYAILKKKPGPHRRPVRRETIRALASGLRYEVTFDPLGRRVILEKSAAEPPRNDIEELLEGFRTVLVRSRRHTFTKAEMYKILQVLKALL